MIATETRVGEMRGTARLVIKPQPDPTPAKEAQQEDPRPERREKEDEHGR